MSDTCSIAIARTIAHRAPLCLIMWAVATVGSGPGGTKLLADDGDFHSLFDGRSLAGWHGDNPHTTAKSPAEAREAAVATQQSEFLAHWRADNGELINDGHGPYATTDAEYGDIELVLEYQTVAKADSGIYLRGTPQIQIWDTTEAGGKWDRHADKGSGGLFNNRQGTPGQLPLLLADKPFGEWNHMRIIQIGARTWVELNHQPVVDGAIMENYWDKERLTPLPPKGHIHLQTHGGEIRWRNLAVRPIGTEEAIRRLRGDDSRFGFTSIFNGQDLSGWRGAVEDYTVEDSSIVCKPGRGGVLFTDEQYDDFVVRLEFQLPPGGNNGLAIRYPGQGHVAYDAMCELQVLDNEADQYSQLDPRQYHGSVYGVAAARRGYLRPAGEWNYQQVSVRGPKIQVELNGTIILDADTSQINEFQGGRAHPGLSLTRGHFGFAGHSDPVKFRNIAIQPLARAEPIAAETDAAETAERDLIEQATGSLIFHASFDGSTQANLSTGLGLLQAAESAKRERLADDYPSNVVSIAARQGRLGDALKFAAKTEQALFYEGSEFGYRDEDWSGSVSVWLKLDPNADLEPGYCDPLQITERAWNDAALFVDFDKELPRDFRLGVFPDIASWNPTNRPFEEIPADERPMVTATDPPFSANEWTHVCFTWQDINDADGGPATATLYLNGEPQGQVHRPLKFTWDADRVGMLVGLNYIGLMDELLVFRKALSPKQVQLLYRQPESFN